MKIPLLYQRTEYDCGPTAFLNAVSFLLDTADFPPDVLKYVTMYTLDSYNERGEACKRGTSKMAMMFLSSWLNQYAEATKLSLSAEFISGAAVDLSENGRILRAISEGGAVVLRVLLDCGHYVTLTGYEDGKIALFDPYYQTEPFENKDITLINDRPTAANREVERRVFGQAGGAYSLEDIHLREAVIIYNTATRKKNESVIEYYL